MLQGESASIRSDTCSEKALESQLSVQVEQFLGPCAEPIRCAYANCLHNPNEPEVVERLLDVSCEAARHVTEADSAAVTFLDTNDNEFVYRSVAGIVSYHLEKHITSDSKFPAACTQSRRPFLSNCVSSDSRVHPDLQRHGIQSLLAIPMVKDNSLIGFFEVCARSEKHFNVTHIISLQVLSSLLAGLLSDVQQSTRKTAAVNSSAPQDGKQERSKANPVSEPATALVSSLSCESAIPSNQTAVIQPVFSSNRRIRARVPANGLMFVSLGQDNGGIVLDINDLGFSMQTAFPLGAIALRQRRVRFAGNGNLELDCELVWERAGKAGFRFVTCAEEVCTALHVWLAANDAA